MLYVGRPPALFMSLAVGLQSSLLGARLKYQALRLVCGSGLGGAPGPVLRCEAKEAELVRVNRK